MTTEEIKFIKPIEDTGEGAPYDDTKGNRYVDFWTFNTRTQTSFEIVSSNQGLRKGVIKFKNPVVKGKTLISLYYLEYEGVGGADKQAALFHKLSDLAKFINNGVPPKIQAINDEVYFEFDATKKWDDSGVIRIGYFYENNNGWNHVKNADQSAIHIDVDPRDHRDIEFWLVGRGSSHRLGFGRYRRDLPLINHVDYYQYIYMHQTVFSIHQGTDKQIEINTVKGTDELGDVYWRYVDEEK